MNNQNFVVLPDILLEKYGYKNSLAICLVLKNKLLDGSCILQFDDIYQQLGYYRQHRQYSQVRQLFINMQKDKLLHCDYNLEEVNNHKLLRVTLFSEGKFIKIPYGDIEKILQYPEKINLFSVYVVIKKHLWEEDSTWDVSYEEIKKYTGIKHNKTIEKYLEILENLQLITKTPSNYKNNNHKPCYTFSLLKDEDKEETSMKPQNQLQPHSLQDNTQTNNTLSLVVKKEQKEKTSTEPPRQQQPPRQQSTAENNNPSFSVVSKKEKERTTTSNAGRVLTEGDKNISPPTTTSPYTIPSPMYLQTEKPEDISDEVWQEWLKQPESLRKGKKLVYDPDTNSPVVLENLNGCLTIHPYRPFKIFYTEYAKRKTHFPILSDDIPSEESERDLLEEQTVQKLQEITCSVCVYGNEDDEDLPF